MTEILEIGVTQGGDVIVSSPGWDRDAEVVRVYLPGVTRKEVERDFPDDVLVGLELIQEE